jgi:hypothetical protein
MRRYRKLRDELALEDAMDLSQERHHDGGGDGGREETT